MLAKSYSPTKKVCRVTFKFKPAQPCGTIKLCGDFNKWNASETSMKKLKDGTFSTTISLNAGASFRFRYFIDNMFWENDPDADGYQPNVYGTQDSIVTI